MVGILLFLYNHFIAHLVCTHPRHAGGDRGATRKCTNHEALRSTWKFLTATQRQYWRKTDTKTTHHQLQCTAIGHRHTRALNSGDQMKICKKHQTFEAIG